MLDFSTLIQYSSFGGLILVIALMFKVVLPGIRTAQSIQRSQQTVIDMLERRIKQNQAHLDELLEMQQSLIAENSALKKEIARLEALVQLLQVDLEICRRGHFPPKTAADN